MIDYTFKNNKDAIISIAVYDKNYHELLITRYK